MKGCQVYTKVLRSPDPIGILLEIPIQEFKGTDSDPTYAPATIAPTTLAPLKATIAPLQMLLDKCSEEIYSGDNFSSEIYSNDYCSGDNCS